MTKDIKVFMATSNIVKENGSHFLKEEVYDLLQRNKDDKYFIMAFLTGLQTFIDNEFNITPEDRAKLMGTLAEELSKDVAELLKDIGKESVNKEEES